MQCSSFSLLEYSGVAEYSGILYSSWPTYIDVPETTFVVDYGLKNDGMPSLSVVIICWKFNRRYDWDV
jgi:hypothetical protein